MPFQYISSSGQLFQEGYIVYSYVTVEDIETEKLKNLPQTT